MSRIWLRNRWLKGSVRAALGALVVVAVACGGSSRSPTDPGEPPLNPSAQIGVVGCSQTSNAWRGWIETGDARVWRLAVGYGGGNVTDWSRGIPNGFYWSRMDTNMASNPAANIIWWQLCDLLSSPGSPMDVDAILAEILRRVPGATIYVTPLAEFERPETCKKQNIANSRVLVDYLVMTGAARRGPELPLVLDEWIQPPQGDGTCHVGPDGMAEFGRVLAGFDWRTQ